MRRAKNIRIAVVAPPWLSVPPHGYGGIEEVIWNLTKGLHRAGAQVELFSVKGSRVRGVKNHYLYEDEQYRHIHGRPYYTNPIDIAQIMWAYKAIAEDGQFDIIHDHTGNEMLGMLALYWAELGKRLPPALVTHHGPPFTDKKLLQLGIPDNLPMWRQFSDAKRLFVTCVSESMTKKAPRQLKPILLAPVHNGIDVARFPFRARKSQHFITMAGFSHNKGQHIAVQLCHELGFSLKMAGTVASLGSPYQLLLELTNPLSTFRSNADFQYYSNEVWPIAASDPKIHYSGNLSGERKLNFLVCGKALLSPIDWEEPFGMAVIEALACGTPVITMRRGAMPEIIKHGVNGFIANNVKEFKEYMLRVDEIDPKACRQTVKDHFSADLMVKNYLSRYEQVLKLSR